jgi:ABC-2 type transport system permease protein
MSTRESSIDRAQLQALLKCYWRMSTRGGVARAMGGGGKPRGLIFVLVMYLIVGFFTSLIAFSHIDLFTFTIIIHSITLFVVGMAITSESGDILFNTNESDVLVHRPIHPRTLLLAKTLNLIAFTLILATALNLFPAFFGLAISGARPWFPAIHLLSMIVLCVFCASAVVCVYGIVIKFLNREKFDNFASWSQVAMSILFIGGYQVVPRLLQRFEGLTLKPYAHYLFPLPAAWFAGFDSALAGDFPYGALLALTGLVLTAALGYIAIGKLSTSYSEGLAKIAETSPRAPTHARVRKSRELRNPLLRWWLRDPIELRVFRLAAAYMRRDRDIKLRLYPSLTIFLVIPLISLLDKNRNGISLFVPLFTVWMLGVMPYQALQTLQMSQHYLAADIFAIAPLASAASVFHGVRKATIFYLLLPSLCVAGLLIGYLAPGGLQGLQLAVPGMIAIPVMSLLPGLMEDYLPFSRPVVRGDQSSKNIGVMLMSMAAMAIVLGAAYIASTLEVLWYLIAIEFAVVVLVYYLMSRVIRKRPLVRDYEGLFSYRKKQTTHEA